MAGVTAVARLLRLDETTWARIDQIGSLRSAAVIAVGAYAMLAFDRFGIQGVFAPRAVARLLLAGFYGWLWLAGASWAFARLTLRSDARPGYVVQLLGQAHLPLLLLGITIQMTSVALRWTGPGGWAAAFVALFWFPALLVAAARMAFGVGTGTAFAVVAGPYALWMLIVGRYLRTQVGHLF